MFFLDEAAIWLTQPNTYSWRPIGQPLRVPTSKARGIAARLNLMGVVEYGSDTVLYREIEGNTTGQAVVDFIEVLAADANPECPTVVLLDRASVHTCSAMNQQRKRWQDLGLIIAHLPAYSPELNDMEPQWRHLKYDKLPERHYQNKTELRRAVGGANWGIII